MNFEMGPIGLCPNKEEIQTNYNALSNEGYVPLLTYTREQFPNEEGLFNSILEHPVKFTHMIISIKYPKIEC